MSDDIAERRVKRFSVRIGTRLVASLTIAVAVVTGLQLYRRAHHERNGDIHSFAYKVQ